MGRGCPPDGGCLFGELVRQDRGRQPAPGAVGVAQEAVEGSGRTGKAVRSAAELLQRRGRLGPPCRVVDVGGGACDWAVVEGELPPEIPTRGEHQERPAYGRRELVCVESNLLDRDECDHRRRLVRRRLEQIRLEGLKDPAGAFPRAQTYQGGV